MLAYAGSSWPYKLVGLSRQVKMQSGAVALFFFPLFVRLSVWVFVFFVCLSCLFACLISLSVYSSDAFAFICFLVALAQLIVLKS